MDSKAQMLFFAKTPTLCVYTEVSNFYNFNLGVSFSTLSPKTESAG